MSSSSLSVLSDPIVASWQVACSEAHGQLMRAAHDSAAVELALRAVQGSSSSVATGVAELHAGHEAALGAAIRELTSVRQVCANMVRSATQACRRRTSAAVAAVEEQGVVLAREDEEGSPSEEQEPEPEESNAGHPLRAQGEESQDSPASTEEEGGTCNNNGQEEEEEEGDEATAPRGPQKNITATTTTAEDHHLQNAIDDAAFALQEVTQRNVALRTELHQLAVDSVPSSLLLAAESRIAQLEAENSAIAHQLSFFVHDQAAAVVHASEENRLAALETSSSTVGLQLDGTTSSGHDHVTVAADGLASSNLASATVLPTHPSLWEAAVREVDEKVSVILLNMERQQLHVALETEVAALKAQQENLANHTSEMELLNRELCRDCEGLTFENRVLTESLNNCLLEQSTLQQQVVELRRQLDVALAIAATPPLLEAGRGNSKSFGPTAATTAATTAMAAANNPPNPNNNPSRPLFRESERMFLASESLFGVPHHRHSTMEQAAHDALRNSSHVNYLNVKTPKSSSSPSSSGGIGRMSGGQLAAMVAATITATDSSAYNMPRNSLLLAAGGGTAPFKPLPGLPRLQTFANAESLCDSSRVKSLSTAPRTSPRTAMIPVTVHLTGKSVVSNTAADGSDQAAAAFTVSSVEDLVKRNKELTQEVYRLSNFSTAGAAVAGGEGEADDHAGGPDDSKREESRKRSRKESSSSADKQPRNSVTRDCGSMTDMVNALASSLLQHQPLSLTSCAATPEAAAASTRSSQILASALETMQKLSSSGELSQMCVELMQSHCDLLSLHSSSSSSLSSARDIANDAMVNSLRDAVELASRQEIELRRRHDELAVLRSRLEEYRLELAVCRNTKLSETVETAAAIVASSASQLAMLSCQPRNELPATVNPASSSTTSAALLQHLHHPSADQDAEHAPSTNEWTQLEGLLAAVMNSQVLLTKVLTANRNARAEHHSGSDRRRAGGAGGDELADGDDDDLLEGSDGEPIDRWCGGGSVSSRRLVRRLNAQLDEVRSLVLAEQQKTHATREQLHAERVAHRALMERMWELEISTAEAESFAQKARVEMGSMLSAEQFTAQSAELEAARLSIADLQNTVKDLKQAETRLGEQLQAANAADGALRAEHAAALHLADEEKRHLSMLIRRHADTQTALENSLLLERRNTADLHQAYDDLKRTINQKDKDIAEARQEAKKARSVMLESVVRLSGEQLRAQFPADVREAIADLNALVNELASARDGLNAEVLRLQAANRSLGEQRQSLQLELQQAHRERQQAMLVTHDLVDRDAAMHEEHAAERGALQAKVSVLEREVLSLQADKAASLEREEAMRVQVDALSSDPISVNVRKYGIPRTKLLQEQMEAMHGRTVETTQALDDERRAAAELRGEVQRLQTALGAASSREAALTVSRDRLAGDKAEVERHKAAAEKVVADQEERLKRLASAIQEREEQVEASRIHAVSLQGMLEQRQGELAASTEQVGTLAGDNVRLLDQVSGLVRDLQDLEAQKRAQDAAIQQLMRSGAGRGGGHYQPHQRGTSSSARTHAAQQQQRRASPTAPTSLTRPVQQ